MAKDETHLVNDRAVKRFSVSYSGAWTHSSFLGARVKPTFAFASMHNVFEMAQTVIANFWLLFSLVNYTLMGWDGIKRSW